MIKGQVAEQGLEITAGFPEGANNNRLAQSNVEPGIFIAPIKRLPDVIKSPTLRNAYYTLFAEFEKDSNGNLVPRMEKGKDGQDHQAVRQVYSSLFVGDLATVLVDENNPDIQIGIGPRVRPTGEAAQIFGRYALRNDGMAALYDATHTDIDPNTNQPTTKITKAIEVKARPEVWIVNRNTATNPSKHVRRTPYDLPLVPITNPVDYVE